MEILNQIKKQNDSEYPKRERVRETQADNKVLEADTKVCATS